MKTNTVRTQKYSSTKRQAVQVVGWVRPELKSELEHIATVEKLSLSKIVATILEEGVRQKLHIQHAVLLQPIIETTIRREIQAYSSRHSWLLLRCLFSIEQVRGIVVNLIGTHFKDDPKLVNQILDECMQAAKRNVTRRTPHLEKIIAEMSEEWRKEEGERHHV